MVRFMSPSSSAVLLGTGELPELADISVGVVLPNDLNYNKKKKTFED